MLILINLGPVDPLPKKPRLPSYNIEKRLLLNKMDMLEDIGVIARPYVDMKVEYISQSVSVRKCENIFDLSQISTLLMLKPNHQPPVQSLQRICSVFLLDTGMLSRQTCKNSSLNSQCRNPNRNTLV